MWGNNRARRATQQACRMCEPRSVVPATVEIVDIAGLAERRKQGEGLGNQFLANIRQKPMPYFRVTLLRRRQHQPHVDGSVGPVRDKGDNRL